MKKKTVLFYILLIAGFFVLLYMILSSQILNNLDIFSHVNIFLLLFAFSTTLLNVAVKIFRWRYLCKLYGAEIDYHEAGRIVIGSFFVSGITPAKVGDVIKAYIMKKRFALPLLDRKSVV